MNIAEAKERCKELEQQVYNIDREYYGLSKEKRIKPLMDEMAKLYRAVRIAENETEIKL